MAELTNDFSWSRSRDDKFRSCLRSYYNHYYGSWGGWESQADDTIQELYVMKNLKTRPMWRGEVVHDLACRIVKQTKYGPSSRVEESLRWLRRRMESDWLTSRNGTFRRRPNRMVGLVGHYYDEQLTDADFEETFEYAEQCVRNLYETVPYRALAENPSIQLLEAEQLRSVDVSGLKVWLKIDLAIQSPERHIEIVDWKTGQFSRQESTELQLAIYALYAARTWSVPVKHITTREVSLGTGQENKHRMDGALLGWAEDYIVRSAEKMKSKLVDPEQNVAVAADFPMTANYQRCRRCNFRGACGRDDI